MNKPNTIQPTKADNARKQKTNQTRLGWPQKQTHWDHKSCSTSLWTFMLLRCMKVLWIFRRAEGVFLGKIPVKPSKLTNLCFFSQEQREFPLAFSRPRIDMRWSLSQEDKQRWSSRSLSLLIGSKSESLIVEPNHFLSWQQSSVDPPCNFENFRFYSVVKRLVIRNSQNPRTYSWSWRGFRELAWMEKTNWLSWTLHRNCSPIRDLIRKKQPIGSHFSRFFMQMSVKPGPGREE